MKTIITSLLLFISLLGFSQEEDKLHGVWSTHFKNYGDFTYVVKPVKSFTNAYIKDYKVTQSLRKELKRSTKRMVLESISFKGNKGKATYKIDFRGNVYKTKCKLELVNDNKLLVKYKFGRSKFTDTWERRITHINEKK